MKNIIVVDDERTFDMKAGIIVHCRDAEIGQQVICNFEEYRLVIDELWLDHDLGENKSIVVLVDWLCERSFNDDKVNIGTVYVHSQNPIGAQAMVRTLDRYGYNVVRCGLPTMMGA